VPLKKTGVIFNKMKKKLYTALLRLYELPIFFEKDEFYDKATSFLYMQFKFKDINIISKKDLTFDLSLFDSNRIVAETNSANYTIVANKKVSNVEEIKKVIICTDRSKMENFIVFKVGKLAIKMFQEVKDIKIFFSNIESFFNKQEAYLSKIKDFVSEQKQFPPEEKIEKITPNPEDANTDISPIKKTDYLTVHPKNMPDRIKLTKDIEKAEVLLIKEMLKRTKGRKVEAANKLGITERMIGYKVRKYELS
jgi:hypothetical protein